jgi:hypothetical protein
MQLAHRWAVVFLLQCLSPCSEFVVSRPDDMPRSSRRVGMNTILRPTRSHRSLDSKLFPTVPPTASPGDRW